MLFPARELARPLSTANAPTTAPDADVEARRLAAGVARGDEAAFQELYDRYASRLFRLALVLGRGDDELARETTQAAFVTAAEKLRGVESEAHLWNWLARVTRQHCAKAWRQRQREPASVNLADLPESAERIVSDAFLEESLDAALLEMEAEDRQVIELFYFENLSHKEIAGRQGTTPKAVSSRLERARAKLRSTLTRRLAHEN